MKIISNYQQLSQFHTSFPCVCTIGMFDGVHRGHLFLLDRLHQLSQSLGLPSVAISFEQHPAEALRGITEKFLLSTKEERIERLKNTHFLDVLYLIPSSKELWALEAKSFLEEKVYPFFEVKCFVMGHDSVFGKNRKGDAVFLEQEGREKGFSVERVGAISDVENERKISSSFIREALQTYRVALANELLGYAYSFSGTVVKGDQRGRKIGFPTANIHLESAQKLIPQRGVYAVQVEIQNEKYRSKSFQGMMNIGIRPTFNLGEISVAEVHILDFSDDIYDETIKVSLKEFIRQEKKFENVEALIDQLNADKAEARAIFSSTI